MDIDIWLLDYIIQINVSQNILKYLTLYIFGYQTTLCKWSQVRFRGSPAGWKLKPSSKKVVCPALEPGQEGDISITFVAPSE